MSQAPRHPEQPPTGGGVEDPLDAFERLILRGHQILHICGWNGEKFTAFTPRGVEARRMRSEAIELVHRCFGSDSRHTERLQALAHDTVVDVPQLVEVLEQARDCYARESLFHVPAALLMQMGEDLIELAEVLANAGHRRPAAAQSVRVLVTHLRRRALAWKDLQDSAGEIAPDDLNDALHAHGAYDESDHRRIAACLRIGADLAGPRADAVPDAELDETVEWVRAFVLRRRRG